MFRSGYGTQIKLLTRFGLQVISTTALNPQAAPTFGGLKLTLDGQELRNPYFTVLEFLNTGSRPLLRSDFESPLEISMRLPAKIVRVEGAAVTPSDLKPILTIKDGQILLQPLLLNSDDKFRVTVLSTGGMPQVAIKGRIAGISKIDFIARTDDQTLSGTWLKALVGILLVIIYFSLGFDAAYQHCYLRKFRPLQLVVGAVCGSGGALLIAPIRKAAELSNTEIAIVILLMGLISAYISKRWHGRFKD